MRRTSFRFSIPLLILAPMLAVTLMFVLATPARAVSLPHTNAASPAASNCLSAAPSTQKVVVGQQANVNVTVRCYPVPADQFLYLYVTWGDGTTSTYPICVEVCRVPPFVIQTSHTYTVVGDYHPLFCTTLTGSVANCLSVEILVLPPV
jgi:hypothetical protein